MPLLIASVLRCDNCVRWLPVEFNPALGPVRGLARGNLKGWTLTTRPQDNTAYCPDCRAVAVERLGTLVGEGIPHEVVE